VGGKQPVRAARQWREWLRTLPLLFALPLLFLVMGLMIRSCGPVPG
jgi:hypothetical protein